ncbi:MAG: signal peptidase II [Candidatus Moranbacteria bacterium]|nr:signal peptidase II [Candidatus Moranbacteria bacterium]
MGRIEKLTIVCFVLLIDQISKYIIRSTGGFYICNEGIAFGIQLPALMFVILWVLFVIFVGCCFFGTCGHESKVESQKSKEKGIQDESKYKFLEEKKNKVVLWGLIGVDWCENKYFYFLLGGGISNLTDRIAFGCVTDFVSIGSFPVFNIADVFISFGAIMMILGISKLKK